jgi:hypothetical protein
MEDGMTRRAFLTTALLLVSTAAGEAQQSDSTHNNLVLAKQAVKQGYPGRAKELVDRAATVARSPQDWFDVSRAYENLGYPGAARDAAQKAQTLLKR